MKVVGSAEAQRRQRRNVSAGGPAGVRDAVPNKSHSRRFQSFFFQVAFLVIGRGFGE